MLIPDTEDIYTADIRHFFTTVASLVSNDFMNMSVEAKQSKPLTSAHLKKIYDSYKNKLTKPENLTRAFIASTYHLPNFNVSNPSKEWLWVAKLCHLLIYFSRNGLPSRISETTVESRKWMDPNSDNHGIWRHCYSTIQADSLQTTYERFKRYRVELDSRDDPDLTSFEKIYRTIKFAFKKMDSITRSFLGRKKTEKSKADELIIQYMTYTDVDDDTDKLISVTSFEKTKNDNDIYRERLDDPVPDFFHLEQKKLKDTEKFSYDQIYRRTQAKYSHANKNERFVSSNIRQLSLIAIQNIASKLWQWFDDYNDSERDRDKKRAIVYLLLSLYTGHSVARLAEDINNKHEEIIKISSNMKEYEFIIHLDITAIGIKTAGLKFVIANRLRQFKLPLPENLGVFLTNKGYPDSAHINDVIADLRAALNLPIISLGRIEKSLYTILIYEVSSTQLATIITSRNSKKRADTWYSSHEIKAIKEVYHDAIKILTARCHKNKSTIVDYLSKVALSDYAIGSQNSPDYPIVSLFMSYLQQKVVTSHNYREKFNFYNLWLWHVSLLLTSIRAVEGAPGYLNQINLQAGIVWISDKEERATGNSQRLVPICSFLHDAMQNFLRFLESFAKRYGRLDINISTEVNKIFDYQRPLLNFIDKKGRFHALRPAIIIKELDSHFHFKPDWTRHVGQRFLHEQRVDEAVILAIFGHEMMGQEAWRKNSALAIGHIVVAKKPYQQLAEELELQQVTL